jgi:hypothetical protein
VMRNICTFGALTVPRVQARPSSRLHTRADNAWNCSIVQDYIEKRAVDL